MELFFDISPTTKEYKAIKEITPDLNIILSENGQKIILQKIDSGLSLSKSDKNIIIKYSTIPSLIRAIGILKEYYHNNTVNIHETPKYNTLCALTDNSRNAVLKISTIKKWIRKLSLMGYNAFMLYTEDTYEIKKYPYFGYLRGRFTTEELKEIDNYADIFGIELIPCIETLSHLQNIFRWNEFSEYNDISDILLADDAKTYTLIEAMIQTMSESIKSRRINIGLDEAHMLGRGKYMDLNGIKNQREIMLSHVKKVYNICKKYGYSPMMWSDMFSDMTTGKFEISDSEKSIIPEDMTLICWNYWSLDNNEYDEIFRCHKLFDRNIGFAGGASTWFGVVPLSEFSMNVAQCVFKSIDKANIKDIYVTCWGDDGSTCSQFFALPTMQLYAENCWSNNTTSEHLSKRFSTCTNGILSDFLSAEQINNVPGRKNYAHFFSAPYRYMLYNDILSGMFDMHILPGTGKHFSEQKDRLKECAKNNTEWAYLFENLYALCSLLEKKAELSKNIKCAYDSDDRKALTHIAENELIEISDYAKKLCETMTAQWCIENKTTGLEVSAIRIGALAERAIQASQIIKQYLNGEIETINELEGERLPVNCTKIKEEEIFEGRMLWNRMVSANVQFIFI